jgi:hypothetical protein
MPARSSKAAPPPRRPGERDSSAWPRWVEALARPIIDGFPVVYSMAGVAATPIAVRSCAAASWRIVEVAQSAVSMALIAFACCVVPAAPDVGITQAAAAESGVAAKAPGPNLQLIHELQTPGEIAAVTWSSDGSKLAASSIGPSVGIPFLPLMYIPNAFGSVITIWDSDGRPYRQIKRPKPFFAYNDTFAFVDGDKQIATPPVSGGPSAFSLFDIDTGEVVQEIPGLHPDKPRNVNGAKVLIASPNQSVLA